MMTDSQYLDSPLMQAVLPVWHNTFWIKRALDMYDGIAACASEINETKRGRFFGAAQQFALDSAIINLCKLYDTSNKDIDKYTVPNLCKVFINHFSQDHILCLNIQSLVELGISEKKVGALLTKFSDPKLFGKTRDQLVVLLKGVMPSKNNSSSLKQLIEFRNKVGAHQEQLNAADRGKLRLLPSLDEMEKLNSWAYNFCKFIAITLGGTHINSSATSTKMAAFNVIMDVLKIENKTQRLVFINSKLKKSS